MKCPICSERLAEVGVLCTECRDELSGPVRISPEQIRAYTHHRAQAALVDLFGRAHPLDPRTLVGRQVEKRGLAVLEPSVSRHHAHITRDEEGGWTLRDLGSSNGTYHGDQLVEGPMPLRDRDRVRFGQIAFYMIEDLSRLPQPRTGRTTTSTIPPPVAAEVLAGAPLPPPEDEDYDDPADRTSLGLPEIEVRLHEPTGGGGGLVEIDGLQVQLTTTQFELMALMVHRMANEAHQPELVRGFVRSSELIAALSWDTREPNENHVKQLVRRVRRALAKADIGDLIESRHRFGYRLRAIPKLD